MEQVSGLHITSDMLLTLVVLTIGFFLRREIKKLDDHVKTCEARNVSRTQFDAKLEEQVSNLSDRVDETKTLIDEKMKNIKEIIDLNMKAINEKIGLLVSTSKHPPSV